MNQNDNRFMAEKIRTQYIERVPNELDELARLDREAKRPANIFGYAFGGLGALMMGAGMSLVMTDLGETLGMNHPIVPGVLLGLIGMAMAIACYPIYGKILQRRKKKYASEIIRISNSITN